MYEWVDVQPVGDIFGLCSHYSPFLFPLFATFFLKSSLSNFAGGIDTKLSIRVLNRSTLYELLFSTYAYPVVAGGVQQRPHRQEHCLPPLFFKRYNHLLISAMTLDLLALYLLLRYYYFCRGKLFGRNYSTQSDTTKSLLDFDFSRWAIYSESTSLLRMNCSPVNKYMQKLFEGTRNRKTQCRP